MKSRTKTPDLFSLMFDNAGAGLHLLAATEHNVRTVGLQLFVLEHGQRSERCVGRTHFHKKLKIKRFL